MKLKHYCVIIAFAFCGTLSAQKYTFGLASNHGWSTDGYLRGMEVSMSQKMAGKKWVGARFTSYAHKKTEEYWSKQMHFSQIQIGTSQKRVSKDWQLYFVPEIGFSLLIDRNRSAIYHMKLYPLFSHLINSDNRFNNAKDRFVHPGFYTRYDIRVRFSPRLALTNSLGVSAYAINGQYKGWLPIFDARVGLACTFGNNI